MSSFRRICSASGLLMIAAVLISTGCASIPKLASVNDNGKNVDLVVEGKTPDDFLLIQQVIMSPDKKQILIQPVDEDRILMDSTGVTEVYKMKPGLDQKEDPYYTWQGFIQHNNQQTSPDGKYTIELHWSMGAWRSITIQNLVTDKTITLESGISRGVGTYMFDRNDRAYIHFAGGSNDLEFYDLKTFKMLKTTPIVYTYGPAFGAYSSMSSDAKYDILVFHSAKLIQFIRFSTGDLLGSMLFLDRTNWILVAPNGKYDGTPEAIAAFAWQIGTERVKLNDFGSNFHTKGLLNEILGTAKPAKSEASDISLAGQLIGKVRQVNGKEIVVASGRAADTMKAGDRLFVMIDGKKVILEVVFPMMASAKCRVADGSNANPLIGSPVFK